MAVLRVGIKESMYTAEATSCSSFIVVDEKKHISEACLRLECSELQNFEWFERYKSIDDRFEILVDRIFELMIEVAINTFKNLLEEIKDSDSKYYQKGIEMLQNKKERIIKEAEKTYWVYKINWFFVN